MTHPDEQGANPLRRCSDLLSIFSGGGLADLGASAAGWQPVGAVEFDPAIAECYATNLGAHVVVGDVRAVDYRPWAGVDALWASPVCTRASIANQGEGEAPEDMEMACAVVRAVRETRPRVVALENVWDYRKFAAFQHIHSSLLEMGYAVTVEHLCAADFGVAQTRRRLILRARRDGRGFPQVRRTHCKGGHSGLLPEYDLLPWVGWYEAIEDLLPSCPESRLAAWQMARLPEYLRGSLLCYGTKSAPSAPSAPSDTVVATLHSKAAMPKAILCVNGGGDAAYGDHLRAADAPAASVTAQAFGRTKAVLVHGQDFRTMPVVSAGVPTFTITSGTNMPRAVLIDGQNINGPGSGGVQMPKALLIGDQQRQIAEADEPAFTVRSGAGGGSDPRAFDGVRVVKLTPRCLARFQSLPDSYVLPEKASLAVKIIGNGVPCLLAQRVMESLA